MKRRIFLSLVSIVLLGTVWYFYLAVPITWRPSPYTQTTVGLSVRTVQEQYPPDTGEVSVLFLNESGKTCSLPLSGILERQKNGTWMTLRPLPLPGHGVPALEHLLEDGASATMPYSLQNWCRRLVPGHYRLVVPVENSFACAEFDVTA